MSSHGYWIPQNHVELAKQARETWQYLGVAEHRQRLGFTADSLQYKWLEEVFHPRLDTLLFAYNDWEEPASRSPIKTVRLREAEAAFRPVYRQLYIGFLKNNPLVREADLTAMGLPYRRPVGGAHTPVPVPATCPVLQVDISTHGWLTVHYQDAEKAGKGKPEGVHGLELKWVMAEKQPTTYEEFIHSVINVHTPAVLKFDLGRQGARVYMIARWENTRGEKGPWCSPVSAVVP